MPLRLPPCALLLLSLAMAGCRRTAGPVAGGVGAAARVVQPDFAPVQPDLFATPGGQPNAWADFDGDGDLDLFVGFRGGVGSRLYRNEGGVFTDVAGAVGVADTLEVRAAAWGDYDADGHVDLYVGFTPAAGVPNRLYRNTGNGAHFVDVAGRVGLVARGVTRQPAFVDFDNDGDLDLSVAFRDRPNALYRNDDNHFTDVAATMGIDDPRKTVGVVWYDMDRDGDLDAFVANQDGDANGFFRNDRTHFVDIAGPLGVAEAGRASDRGGVGPSVADYDNDGDLDLFVANYGPDALYRNDGDRLTDVARPLGLGGDYHSTSAAWGDYDHDGRADLFVVSYLANQRDTPDHFFRNLGDRFEDVMPASIARHNGSHGVAWADYDRDGDLDLAITNNHAQGRHDLFRNNLPSPLSNRSLQVMVVDSRGRATRAGSEVRLFRAGSRVLLGTRLVDTGGGYDSQGVVPVHFGLATWDAVDMEVTFLTSSGRRAKRIAAVDPRAWRGRVMTVRQD